MIHTEEDPNKHERKRELGETGPLGYNWKKSLFFGKVIPGRGDDASVCEMLILV